MVGECQTPVQYWVDGEVVLSGEVAMSQGNRTLETQQATLDRETRDVTVTGGLRVVEPQVAVQGTQATLGSRICSRGLR